MTEHIHTHGRFNNHTVHRLSRILVMATSGMFVMKIDGPDYLVWLLALIALFCIVLNLLWGELG